MSKPARQLAIASGPLEPEALARLADALAASGARLVDVEQSSVRGRVLLGLELEADPARAEELGRVAAAHGVELSPAPPAPPPAAEAWVATAIARELGFSDLAALARVVAAHGASIDRIVRLSEDRLAALELHVALPAGGDAGALKRALLELGMRSAFDVALQRESVFRRAKRLVVFDMDSTLIRIEVIDELARRHGVVDEVSAITERAMHGELDFDDSLRQRVALLAGLDAGVLRELADNLPLTEGAETLVRALKRLGYRVAVISGGFSVAAEALRDRLGLDHAWSNTLEIEDGRLTGRVVGPIVNGARKAELLEALARSEGVRLDQVVAVGDGANDLPMLQRAGLGVAFRAKPRLREAADGAISARGLDVVLHLLGLSERDVRELAAE